jgi:hypothetical protein
MSAAGPRMMLFAMLVLSGCADRDKPVTLSLRFDPGSESWHSSREAGHVDSGAISCRVRLHAVRDLRSDPESLGSMGNLAVRSPNSTNWLQTATSSLADDPRIRIVESDNDANLSLDIDLIKAYIISITTANSTNVVLQAHYSRQDATLSEQVYRGTGNANWQGMETGFNDAMTRAIEGLHRDVLSLCESGAKPTAAASTLRN